ncbi:hypothetical protein [Mangrovivirga cuniculi]|uniref:hypothetical protein n=1 Tax=Mangrovivirga cuniculi TaxID=2715131 RepID=UPI003742F52F
MQRIEKGQTHPNQFTHKQLSEALNANINNLKVKPTQKSDIELLKLMNISALSLILVPYGNIIFQSILLYKNRNKIRFYSIGKRIFSFQILWTLTTSFILLVSAFWQVEITRILGSKSFPVLLMIYGIATLVNCVVIVSQQRKLFKNKILIYTFTPSIF